jgi:hypothetical protein
MYYSDIINNVRFSAYYDNEHNILHILDEMGLSDVPRKSVTNGIESILPVIERFFNIENPFIILYGTDGVISEYDKFSKEFFYVSPENKLFIYEHFKKMMEIIYKNDKAIIQMGVKNVYIGEGKRKIKK